jgi:GMP synthase-like glutamine amidotransferase
MKVLAFRHVPFEGAGRIASVLAQRNIQLDYADLYVPGAPVPDVAAYAALIFLGGPMSANDDLPYLRQEMDWIAQATASDRPVLGICLGAQLMARSLGARVYRNPVKEIGWFDLHFTPAAAGDTLFDGLETSPVFHWHGETFDLPPGALWLASSARCRHQAFRVGTKQYGLQFHLEVTPAMIAEWCLPDVNCGDIQGLDRPLDSHRHSAQMASLAELVFSRWCSLL